MTFTMYRLTRVIKAVCKEMIMIDAPTVDMPHKLDMQYKRKDV